MNNTDLTLIIFIVIMLIIRIRAFLNKSNKGPVFTFGNKKCFVHKAEYHKESRQEIFNELFGSKDDK